MTDESPEAIAKAYLHAARVFATRHRNDGRTILIAAGCGAFAVGGFDWLWRGDWGGGINPLGWNDYARSEFFTSLQFGAIVGGLMALIAAVGRRWKRHGDQSNR